MAELTTEDLLRELNYALPEDEGERRALADDCLRLFEVIPQDFPLVKRTRWYRGLWERVGQLRARELADRCKGVVPARELLLEVVRLLALHGPHGELLLADLEEALEFRRRRRGLAAPLHGLASAVARLREHLGWRGSFEEDERALPESLRVLLLKAMCNAAWADGHVGEPEIRLLTRKIRALGLSPDARREVLAELRDPQPLDRDLRDIEDYRLRLLLYRNIAAVTVADGAITLRENLVLAHFAEELRIQAEDAREIERELFELVAGGGLASLLEGVLGSQSQEDRLAEAGEPSPETSTPATRAALAEAAELWAHLLLRLGDRVAREVVMPLVGRLDRAGRQPSLEATLEALDPEDIRRQLQVGVDEAAARAGNWLDQVLCEALPGLAKHPELRWPETGGKHLRSLLDRRLEPVISRLEAVRAAGRDLAELREDPLHHLQRRGLLPLAQDPATRRGNLFLVPDGPALQRTLRDRESDVVVAYRQALRALIDEADALGRDLLERVRGAGQAYHANVLHPLLGATSGDPEALRQALSGLAIGGLHLARGEPL